MEQESARNATKSTRRPRPRQACLFFAVVLIQVTFLCCAICPTPPNTMLHCFLACSTPLTWPGERTKRLCANRRYIQRCAHVHMLCYFVVDLFTCVHLVTSIMFASCWQHHLQPKLTSLSYRREAACLQDTAAVDFRDQSHR